MKMPLPSRLPHAIGQNDETGGDALKSSPDSFITGGWIHEVKADFRMLVSIEYDVECKRARA